MALRESTAQLKPAYVWTHANLYLRVADAARRSCVVYPFC